jgi:hypothetical protein
LPIRPFLFLNRSIINDAEERIVILSEVAGHFLVPRSGTPAAQSKDLSRFFPPLTASVVGCLGPLG